MTENEAAATGQVTDRAAETYETFFVPALFNQWTRVMLETAGVCDGDDVLDVGCGTGVLARAAARRLAGSGSVTGVDINEGMLTVARRATEGVIWKQGAAEHIPFQDGTFNRVVSQFALMFFADQIAGLKEMIRVARPGGTITIATWASVEQSPGYAAMTGLLRRLFGDVAADALLAPFSLGTSEHLTRLTEVVLPNCAVSLHPGFARFESIEAWVNTDVRGWTLSDLIDDDQYAKLLAAAEEELRPFVDRRGQVRFEAPALILTASI